MNENKFSKIRNEVYRAIEGELQQYFKAREKTVPAHLSWHLTDISLKKSGLMCKYRDCDKVVRAKGYCTMHYQSQCRKVVTMEDEL